MRRRRRDFRISSSVCRVRGRSRAPLPDSSARSEQAAAPGASNAALCKSTESCFTPRRSLPSLHRGLAASSGSSAVDTSLSTLARAIARPCPADTARHAAVLHTLCRPLRCRCARCVDARCRQSFTTRCDTPWSYSYSCTPNGARHSCSPRHSCISSVTSETGISVVKESALCRSHCSFSVGSEHCGPSPSLRCCQTCCCDLPLMRVSAPGDSHRAGISRV